MFHINTPKVKLNLLLPGTFLLRGSLDDRGSHMPLLAKPPSPSAPPWPWSSLAFISIKDFLLSATSISCIASAMWRLSSASSIIATCWTDCRLAASTHAADLSVCDRGLPTGMSASEEPGTQH